MVFKNIIYRQFFWLTFRVTDTKFMLVLPSLLFTQNVRGRFSFQAGATYRALAQLLPLEFVVLEKQAAYEADYES